MDSFLKACGSTDSPRLEIQGGGHIVYALPQAFALLGRSELCDVRLDHPDVSPRHVYLQMIQGRLACFDLGSRSGIKWVDDPQGRPGWIENERKVGIGPFEIRRVDQATHSRSSGSISPLKILREEAGPTACLEFPDEAAGPVRWHVRRAVTLVGRSSHCRVRLPDVSVSWFHCSLVWTSEGLWIVDLMSRSGVIVNGVAHRCSRLEQGDEVLIGRFRMITRYVTSGDESLIGSTRIKTYGHSRHSIPRNQPVPSLLSEVISPSESNALAEMTTPLEPEMVELIGAYRSGTTGPALIMLIERFGQMQQQMLEQFHQSMMMMMMNMGDAHREEMRHVRAEVDRLRELSEELVALKGQIVQAQPSSQPLPKTVIPITAQRSIPRPSSTSTTSPLSGASPDCSPSISSVTRSNTVTPTSSTPGADSGEDPLVLVTRRIAQIRDEQRGRWQRLLEMVRVR